jgi:hypothetical protein
LVRLHSGQVSRAVSRLDILTRCSIGVFLLKFCDDLAFCSYFVTDENIHILCQVEKKIDKLEFIIYIQIMVKYHYMEAGILILFNMDMFYLNNKVLFHG